jgi:hypothetical protein
LFIDHKMTKKEFINWTSLMHLQNTNGRETPEEMFILGIKAAWDEFHELKMCASQHPITPMFNGVFFKKSDTPCVVHSLDLAGNCFKCNVKGMEILRHDHYLDGGTMVLHTNKGDYAYDHRIHTTTYGELYEGYPLRDGSNIVRDESIKDEVRIALANYIANFVEEDTASPLSVLKSIYNKTY